MEPLPHHLETERLVLRIWSPDDAPLLAAAIAESLDHLRPWMPWAAREPVARDDRVHWIEECNRDWEAGGDVVLGMFLGDVPIGGTGLHRRAGPDTLEIGYWIHADHTGRGYVTETAAALTDAAFAVPGIEFVEIHHDRANTASRAVPERLGYTLVGECAPTDPPAPGEDRVHWCWRTDRATWATRRRADHRLRPRR